MVAEIIDIFAKQPHLSGDALCLHCQHEWQFVAPLGAGSSLECPSCGLFKGVCKGLCEPEEAWACSCGCVHFFLTRQDTICCKCGLVQVFE